MLIKKLTKQCAPCPNESTMILQKAIAISLEGRHLVLTLLASNNMIRRYKLHSISIKSLGT